jgi:hypothetical protein
MNESSTAAAGAPASFLDGLPLAAQAQVAGSLVELVLDLIPEDEPPMSDHLAFRLWRMRNDAKAALNFLVAAATASSVLPEVHPRTSELTAVGQD